MHRTGLLIHIIIGVNLFFNPLQAQHAEADNVFHPDSLRSVVSFLASDRLKGRLTGTEENQIAAQFIADEFRKEGISTLAGNNGYFMEVAPGWNNIIGVIKGRSKPDELVIFSAHYDHIGTLSTSPAWKFRSDPGEKKDSIYNGANDNASGVSAIISLAKYFKRTGNNERTILFIAFTGEELGMKGSRFFSEIIDPPSVVSVINIEMIGRPYNSRKRPYYTGNGFSNLPETLNAELRKANKKVYGRNYFDPDPFSGQLLFERSDNYPFSLLGIPAHSIMASSPEDQYYHRVDDETETLDYPFMSRIIKAIALSVKGIVNGTERPIQVKQ